MGRSSRRRWLTSTSAHDRTPPAIDGTADLVVRGRRRVGDTGSGCGESTGRDTGDVADLEERQKWSIARSARAADVRILTFGGRSAPPPVRLAGAARSPCASCPCVAQAAIRGCRMVVGVDHGLARRGGGDRGSHGHEGAGVAHRCTALRRPRAPPPSSRSRLPLSHCPSAHRWVLVRGRRRSRKNATELLALLLARLDVHHHRGIQRRS